MIGVRNGVTIGVLALVGALVVLDVSHGLAAAGWVAGLVCAVCLAAATVRAADRSGVDLLGPADVVTVGRATISCAVAALVADSFVRGAVGAPLSVLATTALVLDAVDGRVARRTGTASAFGARLDGEADAFLMLVLSVYVARSAGTWVLAMGAVRYLFAIAGWALPVDAGAAACATVAQGRHGDRGDRARARRCPGLAPDAMAVRRPRRRLPAAGRVVRARRLVALVPATGWSSACRFPAWTRARSRRQASP